MSFTVAGTIVEAVGGAAWEPTDPRGQLSQTDEATYKATFANVAPGHYEFKITNGSWSQSYGADGHDYPGAPNIAVDVFGAPATVEVYFNAYTHHTFTTTTPYTPVVITEEPTPSTFEVPPSAPAPAATEPYTNVSVHYEIPVDVTQVSYVADMTQFVEPTEVEPPAATIPVETPTTTETPAAPTTVTTNFTVTIEIPTEEQEPTAATYTTTTETAAPTALTTESESTASTTTAPFPVAATDETPVYNCSPVIIDADSSKLQPVYETDLETVELVEEGKAVAVKQTASAPATINFPALHKTATPPAVATITTTASWLAFLIAFIKHFCIEPICGQNDMPIA